MSDMIFAWTTDLVGFLVGAKVLCGCGKQKENIEPVLLREIVILLYYILNIILYYAIIIYIGASVES